MGSREWVAWRLNRRGRAVHWGRLHLLPGDWREALSMGGSFAALCGRAAPSLYSSDYKPWVDASGLRRCERCEARESAMRGVTPPTPVSPGRLVAERMATQLCEGRVGVTVFGDSLEDIADKRAVPAADALVASGTAR